MEYREIVSVTGLGGLYQLLATKSDGAIVRNLADQTTKFISARLHNVTPLETIEVFTTGDNVRLHDVFQKLKENGDTKFPDPKADNNAVKKFFKEAIPEVDEERVYVSDMKKMLKWYEVLKQNELLDFEAYNKAKEEAKAAEAKEDAASSEEAAPASMKAEEAPAEKPAAKKTTAKKPAAKKSADEDGAAEKIAKPKKVAKKKED